MATIPQSSTVVNPVGTGYTATADFSGPEWQTETPVSRRVFEHKSGKQILGMRFGDNSKRNDWIWENRIVPQIVASVYEGFAKSYATSSPPPLAQVVTAFRVQMTTNMWSWLYPKLAGYAREHPGLRWLRSPSRDEHENPIDDLVLPGWALRWFRSVVGISESEVPATVHKGEKAVKDLLTSVLADHDRTHRLGGSQGIRIRDPRKRPTEWKEVGRTNLEPEEMVEKAQEMGYATSYWIDGSGHVMGIVRLPEDPEEKAILLQALQIRLLVTA